MYSLNVKLTRRNAELAGETLLEAGAAAIDITPPIDSDDSCHLRVYVHPKDVNRIESMLRAELASRSGSLSSESDATLTVERIPEDWETQWAEALLPIELVRGLVLVPEGAVYAGSAGERAMVLEKGLVFGFGEHPTTQMACDWLAERVTGKRVLDIGSGTGVLSFVAAHCGATRVLGIDVDTESVRAAQRNAVRNDWQQVCEFSELPLGQVKGEFDVVVANVDAATLIHCAAVVSGLTRGRSVNLALTGILEEQTLALQEAYASQGIVLTPQATSQDWVLLDCTCT